MPKAALDDPDLVIPAIVSPHSSAPSYVRRAKGPAWQPRMKVFRLDPVDRQRCSRDWQASALPPQTVWVLAKDEADARQKVTLATIVATGVEPDRKIPAQPWKGLVTCARDDSRSVAEGVVLTASGKTIEILR